MKVILYSTHCPNCRALETMLKRKNIEFDVIDDIEVLKNKNFLTAPILEVDDEVMDFRNALAWVRKQV